MKYAISFLGTLFLFLIVVAPVEAIYSRSGETVVIDQQETIQDDVYVAGQTVTIRGVIDGDLFCAGQTVMIEATVQGDVFCAAQEITLKGAVQNAARMAGQVVKVEGTVGTSATLLGQQVRLTQSAVIGRNVSIAAESIDQQALVGRDLFAAAQNVVLNGNIRRNVSIESESLEITQGASIAGNLDYTSEANAIISENVLIAGTTTKHDVPKRNVEQRQTAGTWASEVVFSFMATFLLSALFIWMLPRFARRMTQTMSRQWGRSIWLGLLVTFGGAVVPLFILFTLIGFKVSFVLWLIWLIQLILAPAIAGIAVGDFLSRKALPETASRWRYSVPMGIFLLAFLVQIPILGGLVGLGSFLWGVGGLTLSVWQEAKGVRQA